MPCPLCGKAITETTAPFCSVRCKEVDLHRWLSESYRIPTQEVPEEDESLPDTDDDDV